jgi:tetratricopeptide (TPR) repeat protein
LRLDPRLAGAALNRGALRLQEGHFAEAEADFRLALTLGADAAGVHYNWALLHQARQEPAAALASLERVLEIDPGHRPACELRDQLRKQSSPASQKPK